MTTKDTAQNVAFEEMKPGEQVETRKKEIDAIYDIPVQISAVLGSKQSCRRTFPAISASRPLAARQFRKPTGLVNLEMPASSWDASESARRAD